MFQALKADFRLPDVAGGLTDCPGDEACEEYYTSVADHVIVIDAYPRKAYQGCDCGYKYSKIFRSEVNNATGK